MKPGDTVIVTSLSPMSSSQGAYLTAVAREAFPGARVVVLDATLDVTKAC